MSQRKVKQNEKLMYNLKPTVLMGSSGRPVAQSISVCIPTNVAGMVSGLLRSACSKEIDLVTNVYLVGVNRYEYYR